MKEARGERLPVSSLASLTGKVGREHSTGLFERGCPFPGAEAAVYTQSHTKQPRLVAPKGSFQISCPGGLPFSREGGLQEAWKHSQLPPEFLWNE